MEKFQSKNEARPLCKNYADIGLRNLGIPQNIISLQ